MVLTLAILWMFWDVGQAAFKSQQVPVRVRTTQYTVQSGDTLWSIVTRFDPDTDPRSSVDWVIANNPGVYGTVRPGQVLVVPEGVK